MLSLFLYNIATQAYFCAIRIAALFNSKARKWVDGRRNVFQELNRNFPTAGPVIWMHCASHGEFEQGRPLLEALRKSYPSATIVLTFFSPSGMEHADWKGLANQVHYLPADSRPNARRFLDQVKPDLVFFVKYELWYYFLSELNSRNIPTVLLAANFRKDQVFFRWYGGLFRKMLSFFNLILVQYPESGNLLEGIGIRHHAVCGDPRFERASNVAATPFRDQVLEAFCEGEKVLIAGSTWPEDEKILFEAFASQNTGDWKLVLVPHEISANRINLLSRKLEGSIVYSQASATPDRVRSAQVLIVDKMGMLARIYRYGAAAFVGGAVGGTGLHNIIEPAAYGLPLFFGRQHKKFPEAEQMIRIGIAKEVGNAADLAKALANLQQTTELDSIRRTAEKLFKANAGVTKKMIDTLNARRLLPNKKADFQC